MTDEPTAQAVPASPQPIDKLAGALAKAQAKITSPPRNREVTVKMKAGGSYKFKYATLDSIIDHVRGPLTDNGLWFTQTLEGNGDGKYRLVTTLIHSSGQQVASVTPLLVGGGGNQEFGSALTYMRRYALSSLLGIAADEDDDANVADGNTASTKPAWRGPLPRMKLKAAHEEFIKALTQCETVDEVNALATENNPMLDQLKIDKTDLYNGTDDWDGIWDRIQARIRSLEFEPDPIDRSLTIHAPIEGDWRDKLEAALKECNTVSEVNKLADDNVAGTTDYRKLYPDKVATLKQAFDDRRAFLAQAPIEGGTE